MRAPFSREQLPLRDLGSSMLVWREGMAIHCDIPSPHELIAALETLRDGGYPLDDVLSDDGQTLLTDAAGRSAELVKALLECGIQVDQRNAAGQTSLSRSLRLGRRDIASVLLDAGAAVAPRDEEGLGALHYGAMIGDPGLIRHLLECGADIEARSNDGRTPVFLSGSAEAVVALYSLGADLNAKRHGGETALISAIVRDDLDVALALVRAGGDVATATDLGYVALHYAARCSQATSPTMISALVDAGAAIDEETDEGITPLMHAAAASNAAAVGRLLECGANADYRTPLGTSALHYASDGTTEWSRDVPRMIDCIRRLVLAGADIDAANHDGETALHWAVVGMSSEPVEVLLDLGADPKVRTTDGRTPLSIARERDHPGMVDVLLAAGARDDP